jgi:hypothetical protein
MSKKLLFFDIKEISSQRTYNKFGKRDVAGDRYELLFKDDTIHLKLVELKEVIDIVINQGATKMVFMNCSVLEHESKYNDTFMFTSEDQEMMNKYQYRKYAIQNFIYE